MTKIIDPLPSAKGKVALFNTGRGTIFSVLFKLVPANKKYYLAAVTLNYRGTVDNITPDLGIDGVRCFETKTNITATYKTSSSISKTCSLPNPLQFPPGTGFTTMTGNANVAATYSIIGWEENA